MLFQQMGSASFVMGVCVRARHSVHIRMCVTEQKYVQPVLNATSSNVSVLGKGSDVDEQEQTDPCGETIHTNGWC